MVHNSRHVHLFVYVRCFLLAVYRWKETAKAYRLQLISLMVGQLVPIVTAFIYLMGFTPQGIDPVPMVLWVSSFLYLWSINSSRMFTVMPVAKDAIFNSINDGVIVLDESYRLIEFNLASKNMFPQLKSRCLENILLIFGDAIGQFISFCIRK